jgi:alkylation response protein AidB-like acyl-CoA dehydrogenase
VGLGLSVHTLATWGIDAHATAEQRERFVPSMVAGHHLGAYCLSEPGYGSDAAAMSARARRDGDVYRLAGVKAWVTHGGVADRYLVMARTDDTGRSSDISAFVVDSDQAGLTVAPAESKTGMWASPTAQLIFEDAPVPAEELERGKQRVIGVHAINHEDLRSQAFNLGFYELLGVGYAFDARLPEVVAAVRAEDIQRVARQYLRPDLAYVAAVAPRAALATLAAPEAEVVEQGEVVMEAAS